VQPVRFGSPNDVIGKVLIVSGKPTAVVGVMPFGFEFPEKTQVWVPMAWASGEHTIVTQAFTQNIVGRLKSGANTTQSREELTAIAARVRGELEKSNPGRPWAPLRQVTVISLHDLLAGSSKPALLVLIGAVGFVLLIACADVANLLLARAVQRQREIALRAALGATRMRLVRQGLTESILLSSIGGLCGLALAYWSLAAIRPFIPKRMLFVQSVTLDTHALVFLIGVSVVSGLIFGLFPVLHSLRIDLNEPLKESGSSSSARHSLLGRTRNLLAVSEIAMALILLAGAGLLIKSFWRLTNIDTGFRSESVLTASVALPFNVYQKDVQRTAFYDQTLQKISALPGVTAASYVNNLPFGKTLGAGFRVTLEQETAAHLAKSDDNFATFFQATPDYFRTMGIPLLAGRTFTDRDRAGSPSVVIINNAIAQMFWPGENPIGRRIGIPGNNGTTSAFSEIVGIVGDSKHASLTEAFSPEYYIPALQTPPWSAFLAVRISGDPGSTISAIRHAVTQVDNTLPLSTFASMTERVSESVAEPRFRTLLLGIFAGLALILAAAGIYGVMSYSVAQRTREIGIRVAMGAGRGDVLSLILGHSVKLTLIGIVIGLGASWGLTKLLASALYNVTPHDFFTLASVSILLSAVALLASYIPARRAMRVDPLVALRYE
jgi:putative ABC transport system permease protein